MDVTQISASPSPTSRVGEGDKRPQKNSSAIDLAELWSAILAQASAITPLSTLTPQAGDGKGAPSDNSGDEASLRGVREPSAARAAEGASDASVKLVSVKLVQDAAVSMPAKRAQADPNTRAAMPQARAFLDTEPGISVGSAAEWTTPTEARAQARIAEASLTADKGLGPSGAPNGVQKVPMTADARDIQTIARVSGQVSDLLMGAGQVSSASGRGDGVARDASTLGMGVQGQASATKVRHDRRTEDLATASQSGRPSVGGETSSHLQPMAALHQPTASESTGQAASPTVGSATGKPSGSTTLHSLGDELRAWVTSGGTEAKTLTVALEPKELGSVQVVLHHSAAGLEIQLVASTSAGAQQLAAEIPALMNQMVEGGLSVRELSVGLAASDQEKQSQGQGRERGDHVVAGLAGARGSATSRLARAGYDGERAYPMSLMNLYA